MNGQRILSLCNSAKKASRALALADTGAKNKALFAMARSLSADAPKIIRANDKDLSSAVRNKMPEAFIDRLKLNKDRIGAMADSIADIARLKDPVREVIDSIRRPNGLIIKKVRVPIGVILIIYESRPNVTSDCAALCLKSSNAVMLRGGSDAINSNIAIFNTLERAAVKSSLPKNSIVLIRDTDRKVVNELLSKDGIIDLVIPRGGESLIREVTRLSRIPVIKHYKGVCHTFVDESADLKMAEEICYNAKVQRPGVCNAMETLLVHRAIAGKFLVPMVSRLRSAGVEIRGCGKTRMIVTGIGKATERDWYEEYLALILSVKVVDNVDEAIAHIMKYGSYHSDAIVSKNKRNIEKFIAGVDSACVYANASTRFTDGGEFGKGAEMGISTDKIHARGPMGLEELTSYKYVIYGNGQTRR